MAPKWNGLTWCVIVGVLLLATCALAACDGGFELDSGNHATGCVPSPPGDYPELSITIQSDLPARIDLSDLLPPVGNQRSANTCVGWATAYYLKSAQEGIERHWDLLVAEHQFSPSFVYNQRSTSYCASDRGMSIYNGLRILSSKGCLPLSEFPYSSSDLCAKPDDEALKRAYAYRIEDFAMLFRGSGTANIAQLKTYLAEGNPIVAGIPVYQSFMSYSEGDKPLDVPIAGDAFVGGHAILIVGYDESCEKGCFKFVNSWGTRWGNDGYAYMTYEFLRQKGWEAWGVTDHTPQLPRLLGPATELSGVIDDTWQSHVADPSFTWPVSEEKPGMVAYAVYFGPDSTGVSTAVVPEPAYDPPAVDPGTYYLRVSPRDNTGSTGPWSTLFVFRYREYVPPTATRSPMPTPSPTTSPVPTSSQTASPIPTQTPVPTLVAPTETSMPTVPPVPTPTATVVPSATPTSSMTPTITETTVPPTLPPPTLTGVPTFAPTKTSLPYALPSPPNRQ